MITINEAAARSGVTPKAIRLYEARGLLHPVARSSAGYRLFGEEDIAVLRFIGQARLLGLRLHDIATIIRQRESGSEPCARTAALLDDRIRAIDTTISDLTQLRSQLLRVRRRQPAPNAVICGMVELEDSMPVGREQVRLASVRMTR